MRSFSEINWFTFEQEKLRCIASEINSLTKDYILKVNELEYFDYLKNKYYIEPLNIDLESETYGEPTKSIETIENRFREKYQGEVLHFVISYSFSGSPKVFSISPSRRIQTSKEISINERNNTVSFRFSMHKKDPTEFFRLKKNFCESAFANTQNANSNIENFNRTFMINVPKIFKARKDKFINENSFYEAIKLKTNSNTNNIFTVPTVKKRIIPQPQKDNSKEFSSEPSMNSHVYKDVLKIIFESGKSMERKPSLYIGKSEEELRDLFVYMLETRYEGTTATGETFNRNGKTDILLKYQDGSNLFVAECKFWKGKKSMNDAIDQLFDRYLTWSDSKTSLIFFVKQSDMTKVNEIIQNSIRKHPYFKESLSQTRDSSFSYLFKLPQDNDKNVYLEVMTFHYDKK